MLVISSTVCQPTTNTHCFEQPSHHFGAPGWLNAGPRLRGANEPQTRDATAITQKDTNRNPEPWHTWCLYTRLTAWLARSTLASSLAIPSAW